MEKAKVGGIFSIIAGVSGILYLFGLVFTIAFFGIVFSHPALYLQAGEFPVEQFLKLFGLDGAIGIFYAALGTIGITGGICAFNGKARGLASAGAICGTITCLPLGVVALIFTSMARPEFGPRAQPQTQPSRGA
jgi:hypothetical protein